MDSPLFHLPNGSQPSFTCTNESLEAIMAGLEPKEGDTILAIGGSGDQAFAMLEFGARVVVVDIEPEQIAFIEWRREALAAGDYWDFARRASIATDPQPEFGVRLVERDDYFKDSERLARMRANLGNLIVLPPIDIFDVIRGNGHAVSFGKLYLSSVFGYSPSKLDTEREAMHVLSLLEKGMRIYISYSVIFLDSFTDWILPNLVVNSDLSEKARRLEQQYAFCEFNPVVYEKAA